MAISGIANQIALNNILYLTDFSPASEIALPWVSAIAGDHHSKVFVAHVLLPDPYVCMAPECADVVNDGRARAAKASMDHIEGQLKELPHQAFLLSGPEIWTALQSVIQKNNIDLLVLGTRGRTGVQKLLLGSAAEEIWRRSNLPVLTVGPETKSMRPEGRFSCVLFTTDFTLESLGAFPHAIAMARESHARLILLHVVRQFKKDETLGEQAAIEALHRLNGILPPDAELWGLPDLMVRQGKPAEHIIDVARECGADLIVLGVRRGDDFGVATHAGRTTAHNLVVKAPCPVLTIRG